MIKLLHKRIYSFFVVLVTLIFISSGKFILFAEETTHSETTGALSAEYETVLNPKNSLINNTTTPSTDSVPFSIKQTSYILYPGQSVSPKLICPDEYNKKITYSSLNPSVAEFKDGIITAKSKGKTAVLIKSAEYQLKIRVRVKKSIKNIDITQNHIHLNKKDKRYIHVNIKRNNSDEPLVWKSSNKKLVTVNKNGRITGKKNGTAYITCSSKYSRKSDKIKVTVKDTKYIAFTFDDGPGPYTDALLNTLTKYDSRATFFVVGNRLNSNVLTLQKEYSHGHEIGNHSYNHPNLATLSSQEIKNELEKTNRLIKKYTYKNASLIRPPYGSYNATVTSVAKVPLILWSVDTLDWKYRNSNYVKNTILSHAADGEIVLLHDIHKTSVEGFQMAVKKLKEQGYELVTVSELYQIKGIKMKPQKTYFGT